MSTLRVDTIQNAAGTDSPINVPGTAKAWVNFNGTGTVAIRASYNVSSITDNGTGDYTVNFTTAMVDANYSIVGISGPRDLTNYQGGVTAYPYGVSPAYLTTSIRIGVSSGNGGTPTNGSSLFDSSHVNVAIFR